MIVSARSGATVSTVMCSGFVIGSIGTVSVTTMPAMSASLSRLEPSAESRACVTKTQTSFAPCSFSACAPAISVPPVVVMSSPMIAILSRTRPVTSVTATTSCDGRVLCMIAKSASIISAKRTACFARPASGATETTPSPARPRSRKCRANSGSEVMWSTGIVKKPWIWPACRSIVSTRSAPASCSMSATRRAVIGSRGFALRSWRGVGEQRVNARDPFAPAGLAILAGVREPRDDGRDPLRRGELRRLDHQQQLHDVLVDGLAAGLHDEEVGAADRLVVAAVGLAVPEGVQLDLAELDAELVGDALGELLVRAAG